jgi:hypothetical protein
MELILALSLLADPQLPTNQPPKHDEIEVRAVGCIAGDTLTETRTDSPEDLNSTRRWRLRLSKELQKALEEIAGKQVEVFGLAKRDEVSRPMVAKSVRVGRGRAYVGAKSSRRPQNEPVQIPTLRVTAIAGRAEDCR